MKYCTPEFQVTRSVGSVGREKIGFTSGKSGEVVVPTMKTLPWESLAMADATSLPLPLRILVDVRTCAGAMDANAGTDRRTQRIPPPRSGKRMDALISL
jgi:hypothetical protein